MRRTLLATLCLSQAFASAMVAEAQNSSRRIDAYLERSRQDREDQQPEEKFLPDNTVTLGRGQGETGWEFPSRPEQWLNSAPLTAESLEGKGAVLVFFEEESQQCAQQWPKMLQLAEQYADRPVVFIAVNSGSDPRVTAQYVRRARLRWPVILDYDRSFESEMGVTMVSLDNVVQVRYIDAKGGNHPGKWSDVPATTEAALDGAAWRVDPNEVTEELRDAWRAVEFGDFAAAAKQILRHADSRKEETREAAAKLLSAVKKGMEADLDVARVALRERDNWAAYKSLETVSQRYGEYEIIPEMVANKHKELAGLDDVKVEIEAMKVLDKARATAAKGSSGAKKRAKRLLEQLVEDSPGTEAATQAQELLAGAP